MYSIVTNFLYHYKLMFLIASIAYFGDCCVAKSNLTLARAVYDNSTHAAIGYLSWLIVTENLIQNFITPLSIVESRHVLIGFQFESLLCGLCASIIDLDHFIAARSFYISKAIALDRRPILHCTTIPIVVVLILLIIARYWMLSVALNRLAWLILIAFLSHHTRDATRRGYWIYPFGSSPPIPYLGYLFLTSLIPVLSSYGLNQTINAIKIVRNDQNPLFSEIV